MITDQHRTKPEYPDIVEEGYCQKSEDRKEGPLIDILTNPTAYLYQRGIEIEVPIFI